MKRKVPANCFSFHNLLYTEDYNLRLIDSPVSVSKGPKSNWPMTFTFLPESSLGIFHGYPHVNPHPYLKVPVATVSPLSSTAVKVGAGGLLLLTMTLV